MLSVLKKLRIADAFTFANMFFGFLSVITGNLRYVFLSAIMDGVDGAVARTSGCGELGKELDSLADLFSFGFVPAFFLVRKFTGELFFPAVVLSFIYFSCSALRLARFNVVKSRNFYGLPVTASAMLVASILCSGLKLFSLPLVLLLSAAMISDVVYPKIRDLRILIPASIFVILAFFGVVKPLIFLCTLYALLPALKRVSVISRLWD